MINTTKLGFICLTAAGLAGNTYGGTCNLSARQAEKYSPYAEASGDAYAACSSLVFSGSPSSPDSRCPSPSGWRFLYSIHKPSGLDANVYAIIKTSEAVIAFRGTTSNIPDEAASDLWQIKVPAGAISAFAYWTPAKELAAFHRMIDMRLREQKYRESAAKSSPPEDLLIFGAQYADAVSVIKEIEAREPACFGRGFPQQAKACRVKLTGYSLGGGLAQYAAVQLGRTAVTFNAAGLGKEVLEAIAADPARADRARVINIRNNRDLISSRWEGERPGEDHNCGCDEPAAPPETPSGKTEWEMLMDGHSMDRLKVCMAEAAPARERKGKHFSVRGGQASDSAETDIYDSGNPNASIQKPKTAIKNTAPAQGATGKRLNNKPQEAQDGGVAGGRTEKGTPDGQNAPKEKKEQKALPCAYNKDGGYLSNPPPDLLKSGSWTMGRWNKDGKCE
ncbi:MAG: hypothetical protein Q7R35_15090 [Elusimicrobiota bacterium]|nr:hypothetical protein [Elusimicrobiota bacterium]